MTVYVTCVSTVVFEIEEEELAKRGVSVDDLYGYPEDLLDDKRVEYSLSDPEWETTRIHQHPDPEKKP